MRILLGSLRFYPDRNNIRAGKVNSQADLTMYLEVDRAPTHRFTSSQGPALLHVDIAKVKHPSRSWNQNKENSDILLFISSVT